MSLPGVWITLSFNEADFWMGTINMVVWRMWVRTKRILFIGPSQLGGSCFEDLSPADLFWEGGGWAQQHRNVRKSFVFFYILHMEIQKLELFVRAVHYQHKKDGRRGLWFQNDEDKPTPNIWNSLVFTKVNLVTIIWKKPNCTSRFEAFSKLVWYNC